MNCKINTPSIVILISFDKNRSIAAGRYMKRGLAESEW